MESTKWHAGYARLDIAFISWNTGIVLLHCCVQGHTIQPLMAVKVELLGGEVAFVPALDSQMSDQSIPEIVRRWLSALLETCGKVRLSKGAQQVCYLDLNAT